MKVFLILGTLVLASVASADTTVVLTFDPPPPTQPAAGLNVQGVTFGFSLSGTCATFSTACYGDSIGTSALGLLTLSDPILDGPGDGILTLAFDQPSTILSFDLVLAIGGDQSNGVTVALSGPNYSGPALQFGATSTDPSGLSVGSFSYGGSPFTQAVLTFANDSGSQFAMDNLAFNITSADVAAPEPGSWILIVTGMLLVSLRQIRRADR